MPKSRVFREIYLSNKPITDKTIKLPGKEERNTTPLWEVQGLVVNALKKVFEEMSSHYDERLMPSTVFGVDKNGNRKYDRIAGYIAHNVIETINDKHGNMFKTLFTTPINVEGKTQYLAFDQNLIYKRIASKVKACMRKANYSLPLPDSIQREIKTIIENAYIDLLEGKIDKSNNKHTIEEPSDFQLALQMIKRNQKFYYSDFEKELDNTKKI